MAEQFSLEDALHRFCESWSKAVERRSPIVGGRLFHKTVNCHTGSEAFAVTFKPSGAELRPGADPAAHATFTLSEDDWRGLLSGRYGVWSVQLANRQRPIMEEDGLIRQLGLIMQSFALRKE
ncbi:MAG: hypothetical protein HYS09_07860 [Chloroflexi bacterium]|nr:hypothetical protein [Chloroflexota bacterium]